MNVWDAIKKAEFDANQQQFQADQSRKIVELLKALKELDERATTIICELEDMGFKMDDGAECAKCNKRAIESDKADPKNQNAIEKSVLEILSYGFKVMDDIVNSLPQYSAGYVKQTVSKLCTAGLIHQYGPGGRAGYQYITKAKWKMLGF